MFFAILWSRYGPDMAPKYHNDHLAHVILNKLINILIEIEVKKALDQHNFVLNIHDNSP